MRVYIAGPMRGYEEFNHPAFHKAEEWLEDFGHVPINPARINEHLDALGDATFAHYMQNDLYALVCHAEAILMLQGWRQSVGATVEMVVAQTLDLKVGYAPEVRFMNVHSEPMFFASEKPAIPWKTINQLRRTQVITGEHVIDASV